MPIYEYRCPSCGAEVEQLQKYDAEPPACESETCRAATGEAVTMERKVSRSSFELRGGGWAKDGYSG